MKQVFNVQTTVNKYQFKRLLKQLINDEQTTFIKGHSMKLTNSIESHNLQSWLASNFITLILMSQRFC